jgi:hypothetical protein
MKSIAELSRELCGVPSERFALRAFRQCLYPHARPVACVLMKIKPEFFEADLALIKAIGRITQLRELDDEIEAYWTHPQQGGWLRRILKVRVSTQRVERFAKGLLRHGGGG